MQRIYRPGHDDITSRRSQIDSVLNWVDRAFESNLSNFPQPARGCGGIATSADPIANHGGSISRAISQGLPQYSTTSDDTFKDEKKKSYTNTPKPEAASVSKDQDTKEADPSFNLDLQTLGRAEKPNGNRAQPRRNNPLDRQGQTAYHGGSSSRISSNQRGGNGSRENGERRQGGEDPTAGSRSDGSNKILFACPYYKNDPIAHIRCRNIRITKPHYVK
jgi:hypothetical protein